jgi:hypothetical protein
MISLKKLKALVKKDEKVKNSSGLPKNTNHSHYTVCFKPLIEDSTFEGCVAVDMKVLNK